MKWRWLILLVVVLLPVGCRLEPATSRFSSNVVAATFVPSGERPVPLTVAELAAEPATYGGETVQVSGAYQRQPVLVCEEGARPSPVTWTLASAEAEIGATGYDNLLRSLLPVGTEITVTGRWQRWQGPVGCGKEAPRQQLWFLRVQEIVSPMPLARATETRSSSVATLAPAGNGAEQTPEPTTTRSVGETATPSTGRPTVTVARTRPATPTVIRFGTNTPAPATAIPTATGGPDLTATATTTTSVGTASPTAVLSPTATIAGTRATATATATATEEAAAVPITNKGTLGFMPLPDFPQLALVLDNIEAARAHSWQFNVRAGDVITVSAVAAAPANIRLEIEGPGGSILASQNSAPAGSVETVAGLEINSSGTARAVVHEASRQPAYYALLLDNSSFNTDSSYLLAGVLNYNQGKRGSLPPETDHIWVFRGEGGDVVSINLAPQGSADLIFHFYGPSGEPLLDEFKNDSGSGQAEFELNYTLQDDGLYAIHVAEFDYREADYTLTVSSQ